jgi:predicted acylesterase/phospholipase RssA
VVCSSVYRANDTILLRTYEASEPCRYDYTIVDVVLATMATPKWFDPVTIGYGQTFVGGGTRIYNPIEMALKEIRSEYRDSPISSVISIGCGRHSAHRLQEANVDGLNQMLLSMMHDCDNIAESVKRRHIAKPYYQRLSVEQEMTNIDITDWSRKRRMDINTQAKVYIRKADVVNVLATVVNNLIPSSTSQVIQPETNRIANQVNQR